MHSDGGIEYKKPKPQALPWNLMANILQSSLCPLTLRPLLPSLQRALSPTLPQHLAHQYSAGVFKVIPRLVPYLPYLETFSDCVKDAVRATVGWLWWLNNAWNQQWPRGRLLKWVVGWGQGLVSICGDLTFPSMGSQIDGSVHKDAVTLVGFLKCFLAGREAGINW